MWREKAESAATYDQGIGNWVTYRETQTLMALLPPNTGLVLDFPSGSGRLTKTLIECGHRVVAADLLPDMAAFTKRLVGPRVAQADIFAPPFRRGTFQTILAIRIFFHYQDQAALLSSLAALLAPGGRVIFDTLNPFSTRHFVSPLVNLSRRDTGPNPVFTPPSRVLEMAQKTGLKLAASRGLHILPTRIYNRVPHHLRWLLQGLERRIAEHYRVLTFWAFDR